MVVMIVVGRNGVVEIKPKIKKGMKSTYTSLSGDLPPFITI